MSRMWWYTLGVLVLWVINPELRRLSDWCLGSAPVDVFPLLPFVALLPHLWSLTYGGGWKRLPKPLLIAAWVWVGAFSYSFLLALVNNNALPGTFTFANFVFPIGLGLWVAAERASLSESFSRITRVLFALTTIISIYGIIQYVVAPAWDTLWLQRVIQAGSLSFGRPHPFEIRVFSMLASPGPFGSFMAVMLLLALPGLSLRRPWALAQIPIWLIAFGLSLDRSGWLLFATGAALYLVLTPRRAAFLGVTGVSAALLAVFVVILPAAIGSDKIVTSLNDRLATLSALDTDRSGNERQNLYDEGASLLFEAPFGHGLGVVGTATKLSENAATTDFDSGVLSRLLEMGIPGIILFAAVLSYLLWTLARTWAEAGRAKNASVQCIAGMAIAVEVGLVGSELFGDVNGVLVLALWLVVCFAVRARYDVGAVPATFAYAGRLAP